MGWSWDGSWSGSGSWTPTSLENYRLTPKNPPFGSKWHFWLHPPFKMSLWGHFWDPLSKTEKWDFPPGTKPYNSHYYCRFTIKSALLQNPRPAIRVATPPISLISFLLTAHARILTPHRSWAGGWTLEVGAGNLELEVGC